MKNILDHLNNYQSQFDPRDQAWEDIRQMKTTLQAGLTPPLGLNTLLNNYKDTLDPRSQQWLDVNQILNQPSLLPPLGSPFVNGINGPRLPTLEEIQRRHLRLSSLTGGLGTNNPSGNDDKQD